MQDSMNKQIYADKNADWENKREQEREKAVESRQNERDENIID